MNEFPVLLYMTPEGEVKVNAVLKDETLWLTQLAMTRLFEVDKSSISRHLKNIFAEGELDDGVAVAKFATTTPHGAIVGKTQEHAVNFYNLDAIIAVGYRVNSRRATPFRIWATSERRIWQQITDIFAECSIDYDRDSETTRDFYGMVQNRFHFAITGETAAEIVYRRVDRSKPSIGLATWKNAPDGRILKSDVAVAKNYLDAKQIRQLEVAVTGFFGYIESLVLREQTFTMKEFAESANAFLSFGKYKILVGRGASRAMPRLRLRGWQPMRKVERRKPLVSR